MRNVDPERRSFPDTAFGSLAWVSGVAAKSSAQRRRIVFDLAGESCTSLPAEGPQWFLINHRNEDQVGKTGYFAVRILYTFDEPIPCLPPAYAGIHLLPQ